MRKIIMIPMIHPKKEMMAKSMVRGFNPHRMEELYSQLFKYDTDLFWNDIEICLNDRLMNENFKKIKIYQDALDKIPSDEDIKVGIKISRNWEVLFDLKQLGATVMVTESQQLLDNDEREMAKGMLEFGTEKRDVFIAKKIDKTLNDGELGILFIGVVHQVHKHLKSDIKIEWLNIDEKTVDEYRQQLAEIWNLTK